MIWWTILSSLVRRKRDIMVSIWYCIYIEYKKDCYGIWNLFTFHIQVTVLCLLNLTLHSSKNGMVVILPFYRGSGMNTARTYRPGKLGSIIYSVLSALNILASCRRCNFIITNIGLSVFMSMCSWYTFFEVILPTISDPYQSLIRYPSEYARVQYWNWSSFIRRLNLF